MDIINLMLIAVGIPLVALVFVVISILSTYREELEAIDQEMNSERYEGRRFFGKLMVFLALPQPCVIYGILVVLLIWIGWESVVGETMGNIALAACLSVGLSCTFSIIAQQPLLKEAVKVLIWKDRPPKGMTDFEQLHQWYKDHGGYPFGKLLVANVFVHTMAIYGLLFAELLLVFSGIIGEGDEAGQIAFTLQQSESLLNAAIVLGASSSGALLSAFGLLCVKGDWADPQLFGRRMLHATPGAVIATIGLAFAFMTLMPMM